MERLPLHIILGPDEELVLVNGEIVAGVTDFELDASTHVKTTFTCVNCFPRPSGHRVGEPGKYPLHIYVGDDVNEIVVSLNGKPVGMLREIQVKLSTTQKRIVRITSYVPLPEELEVALLDLGVEIIVQPPDTEESAGGQDAHL
jgi:hypothetical protein